MPSRIWWATTLPKHAKSMSPPKPRFPITSVTQTAVSSATAKRAPPTTCPGQLPLTATPPLAPQPTPLCHRGEAEHGVTHAQMYGLERSLRERAANELYRLARRPSLTMPPTLTATKTHTTTTTTTTTTSTNLQVHAKKKKNRIEKAARATITHLETSGPRRTRR